MSIKVLVADDSITIQKVIGIIFGGDEYSLTVVDNGKAAVDKAREINPDILLIDALMPGMTGYEVTEAVRSTPSLAAKPILILTGSFEPFDEEKAKKCGADDFIAKPFESQQIINKVKELLELGTSRAMAALHVAPQAAPEMETVQAPEIPSPVFDIPSPPTFQQPEAALPTPPTDIWGAFTPEVEVPVVSIATPLVSVPSVATNEPDVFAIVSEENDAQLIQAEAASLPDLSPQHTGSQWVPVEESTFEFEEEVVAEPPPAAFTVQQSVPVQEASFGDIAFEDDYATPATPVFAVVPEPKITVPAYDIAPSEATFDNFTAPSPIFETPPAPAEPFAPLPDPLTAFAAPVDIALAVTTSASVPDALTEEQLKAALAGVSKEVIERIVWEVVPDLAEVLIREAIRKIKEGM